MTVAARASAAEPTGRAAFRAYAADDGLTNLVTRHLAQDRLRFVWVGTDDGVYRFDGERFARFGLEAGLPSTRVTGLVAAPDGRLWMASRAGLAVIEIGDEARPLPTRFTSVPAADAPRGVVLAIAAAPLAADSAAGKSALWVGTTEGLFREEPVGSARFVAVPDVTGEITALWLDRDGSVQLGRGTQAAVYRAPGSVQTLRTLDNRIDRIVRDRLGRLWLRTPTSLWMQSTAGAWVDHSARLPAISTNGYLALDQRGDVWAMTNRGLLQIDGERFSTLTRGLPTDWSWSFLDDHEGSRWIGSTGLYRQLGRGLFTSYGTPEGFPSEIFWELRRDRDGALLAGTDEGLVKLTAEGAVRFVGTEKYTMRSFVIAPDGTYWAAGSPAAILHLAADGKRVLQTIDAAAGLRGKTVMAMHLDASGTLWLGTDGGGLQSLSIAAPTRVVAVPLPQGTPTELVSDIRGDARGGLWIASELGLARRDGQTITRFGTKDGLRAAGINTILLRQNGEVCVSYFDSLGLSCFTEQKGALTIVKELDQLRGLASSRVYSLGEDREGRLWVGTGAGADVVAATGIEHFGKTDGMPGDDCDSRSFLADADGTVWVGTSTGLARFDGARYTGPPLPPATTIVAAKSETRALSDSPLHLSSEERTLVVEVAAPSYAHERRVHFQSRLAGFDDWHVGAIRELRYAGLPPGRYRFEARAQIEGGAWGPVVSVPVVIDPAWYQTWLARALGVVLAMGLVLSFVGWRVRRLRLRNLELEGMVKARTAELATANQALTDLSLTDPLTGLRNRRYLTSTIPTDIAQVQRTYRDLTNGRSERLPRNVDLVFLLVDLDHFKQINDRHGHGAGDRVLQDLRGLLIAACRTSDIVARWGGEEFLIVARNSSRDEAPILAERIRASIAAHPFEVGADQPLALTCSVGFAAFPFLPRRPDVATWEEVIDLADRCLYLAKREGRDRWVGVAAADGDLEGIEGRGWLHRQFDGLLAKGDLRLQRSAPPKGSG